MTNRKYWVAMTDKFMSGYGIAEGKINKYIVECDNIEQAFQIKKTARYRNEMKHINIHYQKPYYTPSRYLVTHKRFSDLGEVWTGIVRKP